MLPAVVKPFHRDLLKSYLWHMVFLFFVFFCAHRGTNTKLQTKTRRGKLIST